MDMSASEVYTILYARYVGAVNREYAKLQNKRGGDDPAAFNKFSRKYGG